MRAWIFSDLHIDVNARSPWIIPDPRPDHDIVIIAGDICQGVERGVRWIHENGFNRKPVIYVPGNHEYYGFDFQKERQAGHATAASLTNIHVLDRDIAVIDGIAFLGATLWTDYRLFGERSAHVAMMRAERMMNDHRMIHCQDRHWTVLDAVAEYERSEKWLAAQLDGKGRDCVVVTHTAPSLMSVAPQYRTDLLSAAFASNLDHLLGRPSLWIHGHTHSACDYAYGEGHVVCNPRGYARFGEDMGFRPALVRELGAK